MLKKMGLALLTTAALGINANTASAAEWTVTVTNLTHGNYITPLLLAAHEHTSKIYTLGSAASIELEHLAECGHTTPLKMMLDTAGANTAVVAPPVVEPPVDAWGPGLTSTSTMIMTTGMNSHLTVAAMLLPTNDAFVALNSQHIPDPDPMEAKTYTYYINAYDAGTEINDEMDGSGGPACAYTDTGMMPGVPGGDGGSGGTGAAAADTNSMVHVHRGVLGDMDNMAGKSDLDSTIHRWQNPVAKVTVTVAAQ